jgi:predicted phage baseplate assembly protein
MLNSDRFSREFVVETETDGTAYVRFGDDRYGKRPASGTTFTATYRVGNGVAGNIGAEALVHIVSTDSGIQQVRNPLPARGGIEPESLETVRQNAPYAFRTQERAVTPEDYARVTERHPEVQRAAATFRWTGSWYTVFVTVDRLGGLPVDEAFEQEMRQHLERYRMAGYDLEIDAPRFVSLEIEMAVCVKPDYFRSDVKKALLEVFSDRILPDGRRGVFHPDNFTFGQPVYLSQLYTIAQAVAGVASVEIIKFQRQGTPSSEALNKGKLELGRLEIARLDNNPNFPERGVFRLTLEGGK